MIKCAKNVSEINAQLKKLSSELNYMTPWFQSRTVKGNRKKSNDKVIYQSEPYKQFIEAKDRI